MTGYTVHTGSSVKFSEGWDEIFGKTIRRKPAKAAGKKRPAKAKAPAKKRVKPRKSR